jgi:hypothetical protein
MTDVLVDSNGFPRSDIDLVVVTTARSNIVSKYFLVFFVLVHQASGKIKHLSLYIFPV